MMRKVSRRERHVVPRLKSACPGRVGLTLLEVVIALAIFLVAMVPIWRLVSMGSERALDIQQQAQASMLCQGKLDGVKCGADPLNGGGTVDIGNVTWTYTIESSQTDVTNLNQVKVTVKYDRPDGKTVSATLTQLVLDPAVRGSTVAGSSSSGSSSGSSSPSSNNTGGM
jgi:type II secretion system protein I